ncbi:hemerythrin domain-containing protein [Candidatus Woesearchaeota archaeon]|nr:hemerythrin domain-containing protein [Candidatus Woesearchaeota archaeon]
MKPTDQLKNEHEAIRLMLKILDKICRKIEAKEKVNPKHLEQAVDFIKTFADKCHHGKEENLLFPALEESGIPKEEGPIAVMLMEHNSGREYVKNMNDSIAKYKTGYAKTIAKFIENARNYINLLEPHIDKENNILYMIADMHISDKKQKELLKQFKLVENKVIGKGKHKEYHKLLHNLKKIYLK